MLNGTVDAGFWNGLVIKLSVTEPAVRHAMLAVSSLHECIETGLKRGRERDRSFAYKEYTNAIASLRSWAPGDEPSAIPLLVCILFVCFEFLADREAASQMHICQGRKILSGLGDGNSPTMEMIKESLVPIYARLSLASFLFGSRPPAIPEHLVVCATVPLVFTSIAEARTVLYHIQDEAMQFITQGGVAIYSPETTEEEMKHLQDQQTQLLATLGRWNAAFTVLAATSPPAKTNAMNMLRIYHQASSIWISSALQPLETAYDAHLAGFANIISLASAIVNSPGYQGSKHSQSAFTFETELVAPVYWTCTKCRHPVLRRAALGLLRRDQVRCRRENLWHADASVVVAIRVIEMEEAEFEYPFDWALDPVEAPAGFAERMTIDGFRPGFIRRDTNSLMEEIIVSRSQPPNYCPPPPSFNDPLVDFFSDDTTSSDGSSSSRELSTGPGSVSINNSSTSPVLNQAQVQEANLEAPFGIEESRRVKNAAIGPREGDGVWVTFFRDPEPGGTNWKLTREFLRYRG